MNRCNFRMNAARLPTSGVKGLLLRILTLTISFAVYCRVSIGVETVSYLRQIKPLFTEKCVSCHGALRSEAGLRLDAIQFIRAGSDSGSIVEPESTKLCMLLERVTSREAEYRMPPDDAGTALSEEQTRLLTSWIEEQLPGPEQEAFLSSPREHWAYQGISRPSVSEAFRDSCDNPIDCFIREAQAAKGVRSLNSSTDATWLRRVTFDLSGLPPSADDLQCFVEDRTSNKRQRIIDRLLSQSTYGERWGRHWMDIWRYSDWDGYKNELRTSQRHIWHWRDWIIESLNANKPYDQMIVEMLAADELVPGDQDALRATGFLARNFHKSNRNIWLDATVEHTAKAFLGLTLNCAKCHDHKYDPIPQNAYYQFRAIFEPHRIRTDQIAGESNVEKDGIPRAYDDDLQAATYLYVRGNEKNPLKDMPIQPSVPDFFQIPIEINPVELPLESYYPELSDLVRQNILSDKEKAVKKAFAKLRTKIDQAEKSHSNGLADLHSKRLDEFTDDIDLISSELKLAMADQASMLARFAAENAKYSFARRLVDNTMFTVQPIFKRGSTASKWTARNQLAKEASCAEFWHKRAQASHDLLLKQREYHTAELSSSSAIDASKRDASLKSAKVALEKAQKNFDALPSEPDADSIGYSPIGTEFSHQSSGRRLALARWIVDPRNPLTARVAINHIWLRHFGTPLVENTFDFGMSSPKPELVDLLNWLASELITSGWDMKHLHRLILSSDAYARASDDNDQGFYRENSVRDSENKTYWRANVRRLDAEEIRDSMLAVSNMLDDRLFGVDIDFANGETVMRRSLYFRHAYEKQMPMLVLFDAASPNECYRRKPSLVPQQALALANSGLARRLANQLAENCRDEINRESSSGTLGERQFVDRLFQTTISRSPSAEELKICITFLDSQTELLHDSARLTRFSSEGDILEDKRTPAERAKQSLALVLFNHHDFVSIR